MSPRAVLNQRGARKHVEEGGAARRPSNSVAGDVSSHEIGHGCAFCNAAGDGGEAASAGVKGAGSDHSYLRAKIGFVRATLKLCAATAAQAMSAAARLAKKKAEIGRSIR